MGEGPLARRTEPWQEWKLTRTDDLGSAMEVTETSVRTESCDRDRISWELGIRSGSNTAQYLDIGRLLYLEARIHQSELSRNVFRLHSTPL